MTLVEEINETPVSSEYEEIIFDLPGPWKGQNWNYCKFTKSDGTEWYGVFREKFESNLLICDLPEKGIALIVSGGHGYLIDIDRKIKMKDLETEPILDSYVDKISNTFYISRWWDCKYIGIDLKENEIEIPIDCDGIYFKERQGQNKRNWN